jgi:hypothetical protein
LCDDFGGLSSFSDGSCAFDFAGEFIGVDLSSITLFLVLKTSSYDTGCY